MTSSVKAVVIYDPASSSSRKFIEQTNAIPLPINKKGIYERIKSSPYKIQSVPCILTFQQDGNIEKYEGIDGVRFMEALNNMEDEKAQAQQTQAQQENNPEIALAGNERFMVPERKPDDNRLDPEEMRRSKPLQDVSEIGSNNGMTFASDRKLVDQMKRDVGK
jgi:hypothetical protein